MTSEAAAALSGSEVPPLSKNQLKKLKRQKEWEANRAEWKAHQKVKTREKKQRKRAAREGAILTNGHEATRTSQHCSVQLPITLVLDCGFDELMNEKELKSLGSQVTRCYSDNHKAPYQAHLAVSSFGGKLKERFEGVLAGHCHSWRNVRFLDVDFVEAATQAKEYMDGPNGGKLAGSFDGLDTTQSDTLNGSMIGEVVYLTSDSPNTLTELRPYSTYIIGGLVDRNRHKGICYKRAMDRNVPTAKLPIGDYMKMASRFVLATNHVAEIMIRWLELGDWGQAFEQVIPKRKGGVLRVAPEDEEEVREEPEIGEADIGEAETGEAETAEAKNEDANIQKERSESDVKINN